MDVEIDRQPPAPTDRRAPITYRVHMPKIDVARLNALWPKPKHSENPPETARTPSDDGEESMEIDRKNSGGIVKDLEVQIGAVCNLQTNQLCLTLIDPNAHYDPIPVKTPQKIPEESMIQESLQLATVKKEDEHHHESFAVETATYATGADKLHEGFTDEELLNMQIRYETDQHQSETSWGRTRTSHPIDRAIRPSIDTHHQQSIDNNNATSIDNRQIPNTTVREKYKLDNQFLTPYEFGIFRDHDGYAKAINGRTLQVSREDIANIFQTANGADNLFMHHPINPEQEVTKEFYDIAGDIDNSFKHKSRYPSRLSIDVTLPVSVDRHHEFGRRAYDLYGNRKLSWEEKDEYGIYRDDQRYARDLDGNTIRLHNTNIRRVLERASRDEPSYICLPEHATLFTQIKLVP
ncbi:hypothetical protein F2Q69_00023563 [Brassica cretica]|uniref:Uncharacterized protein n=1 Tax=Brassica cretica TaxID=69181 RepID=A0A8S9Q9R1_BRACR|nr:hypothetical protein F2Q69_00023563 [Brassica cretica]